MKTKMIYNGILATALVAILFAHVSYSSGQQSTFHHAGVLSRELKNIFNHLGHPIETLDEANAFAQKHLLRKGERWETQNNELFLNLQQNEQLLVEDLASLHMIDEITPAKQSYDYILFMGAPTGTTKKRLQYLARLKQIGLTFKKIVLLSGERKLRDSEKKDLPADVTTEAQMTVYLCKQNPTLQNDDILLVDAPMIEKPDGSLTRPTTDTTIIHFARIAPYDGTCLVISNAPYIIRQTRVTGRILDKARFPVDGAGPGKNRAKPVNIVLLMDELARTLYEEYKAYKTS